ncbi:MAG: hypothetical protein ACI4XF_07075, partial [Oscillospiraceae bacterium]
QSRITSAKYDRLIILFSVRSKCHQVYPGEQRSQNTNENIIYFLVLLFCKKTGNIYYRQKYRNTNKKE